MRKFISRSVILAMCVGSGAARADIISCSTPNQNLYFHTDYTNGGVPRPPAIELKLGDQILIQQAPVFPIAGAPAALATYSFAANEKVISTQMVGTYTRRVMSVKIMTVNASPTGATLFSDYVFCESRLYVGPPIP